MLVFVDNSRSQRPIDLQERFCLHRYVNGSLREQMKPLKQLLDAFEIRMCVVVFFF